jgi:hypothetical protein
LSSQTGGWQLQEALRCTPGGESSEYRRRTSVEKMKFICAYTQPMGQISIPTAWDYKRDSVYDTFSK